MDAHTVAPAHALERARVAEGPGPGHRQAPASHAAAALVRKAHPRRPAAVEGYFAARAGHQGIKAAGAQYHAWRSIAQTAQWRTPDEVKNSHPKASILKGGRVVFNIKANDYRLVSLVDYKGRVVMIRFFCTHQEYDEVDAGSAAAGCYVSRWVPTR